MSMLSNRHHEDRPWGSFDQFTANEETTVKIVRVAPEKRLSLQKHAHRAEFWKVLEGTGTAQVNDTEQAVSVGDELEIPAGAVHRLSGGPEGVAVLEIAIGNFDENDIERIADDFGRSTPA